MNRVRIVTPIYNDWLSFSHLLADLNQVAETLPFQLYVTGVNDGSSESPFPALADIPAFPNLMGVEILHLALNLGHQRAIAVGLCVAADDADADAVIIMDADGEDPPDTIPLLTSLIRDQQDFCFVAQRRKRVETLAFKASYFVYKTFFKLLTGRIIKFGNYSIISFGHLQRLVMVSDLWNNLPAAILRSRIPIQPITIDRGRRYAGKSKMNLASLVVHGFSGISVYADTIFVRLLLFSGVLILVSAFGVAILLALRIFAPAHATPGWATTVTFGLCIIILQLLFTALSSLLMLLNNRVQRLFIPRLDYLPYLRSRQKLFCGNVSAYAAARNPLNENSAA